MYTSFASNIQKHFFLPSLSSLSDSWCLPAFIFYPSFLSSKLPVTKIKIFQGTKSSCSQTRSLVKPELTQPGLINGVISPSNTNQHQHVQQRNTFVQCGFGIASTALLGERNVQNCCAYECMLQECLLIELTEATYKKQKHMGGDSTLTWTQCWCNTMSMSKTNKTWRV